MFQLAPTRKTFNPSSNNPNYSRVLVAKSASSPRHPWPTSSIMLYNDIVLALNTPVILACNDPHPLLLHIGKKRIQCLRPLLLRHSIVLTLRLHRRCKHHQHLPTAKSMVNSNQGILNCIRIRLLQPGKEPQFSHHYHSTRKSIPELSKTRQIITSASISHRTGLSCILRKFLESPVYYDIYYLSNNISICSFPLGWHSSNPA